MDKLCTNMHASVYVVYACIAFNHGLHKNPWQVHFLW